MEAHYVLSILSLADSLWPSAVKLPILRWLCIGPCWLLGVQSVRPVRELLAMTNERTRRLLASIAMQMVRQYRDDLAAYYAGDVSRFTRMVVDQGKALPSASPQGWANHINNLAIESVPYYADELRTIFAQLAAWDLKIDDSILNEVQR